jgi:hypothetical protein
MMLELETSRTTEAGTSFVIGERVFHVVVEVVTVRTAKGKMFAASISPIALLILESHDCYAVSLTGEALVVDELLTRVPALREKILAEVGR